MRNSFKTTSVTWLLWFVPVLFIVAVVLNHYTENNVGWTALLFGYFIARRRLKNNTHRLECMILSYMFLVFFTVAIVNSFAELLLWMEISALCAWVDGFNVLCMLGCMIDVVVSLSRSRLFSTKTKHIDDSIVQEEIGVEGTM